jgi:hypothetical protein
VPNDIPLELEVLPDHGNPVGHSGFSFYTVTVIGGAGVELDFRCEVSEAGKKLTV